MAPADYAAFQDTFVVLTAYINGAMVVSSPPSLGFSVRALLRNSIGKLHVLPCGMLYSGRPMWQSRHGSAVTTQSSDSCFLCGRRNHALCWLDADIVLSIAHAPRLQCIHRFHRCCYQRALYLTFALCLPCRSGIAPAPYPRCCSIRRFRSSNSISYT